ncbi:MAG: MBL fold metallo-hydrolase [Planctomycetes bacterium]|nr:MBL fold metallo-hydrolase [Planctomycetota bacterium]
MTLEIKTITIKNMLGSMNCYLLKTDSGFILIDTGLASMRKYLMKHFKILGCVPSSLKLVILTHGDFDHIGNAAFLRENYDTAIAMHKADSGMAEFGDMFWNRRKPNIFMKVLAKTLFGLNKSDRFMADFFTDEGFDLSRYGVAAKIIHIPGHSSGSIGILTADGKFFCGDIFVNKIKPALNSLMDDKAAAQASVEKLMQLNINKIYPGHGKPFSMAQFFKDSEYPLSHHPSEKVSSKNF